MGENTPSTDPCEHTDFFQCHLAVLLWKVFSPILLVIGITGNVISLAVWSRKRMCITRTSLYFRILAVVDSLVLVIAALRELIFYSTNIDIQVLDNFSCRVHSWLAFSVTALFAWILSALAIDRLVFVKFPVWAKLHCSKNAAAATAMFLTIVVFLTNSHMLFYLSRTEVYVTEDLTNKTVLLDLSCVPFSDHYTFIWHQLWPVVVLVLYSCGPTICLITCSILLIRSLLVRNAVLPSSNSNAERSKVTGKRRNLKPLTRMLIAVCLFFIVCTLPVCIFLIVEPALFNTKRPKDLASRRLGWAIVALILYCNNAFNCIIYCIRGKTFRSELRCMFMDLKVTVLKLFNKDVSSNRNIGSSLPIEGSLHKHTATPLQMEDNVSYYSP